MRGKEGEMRAQAVPQIRAALGGSCGSVVDLRALAPG